MNRYAAMAWRHWERLLPETFAAIPNPEEFFTSLGENVAREIEELALSLAGDDPPGETYMGKLGRLNMARAAARERVLPERVLLPPENEENEGDEGDEDQFPGSQTEPWAPVVEDPTHPFWARHRRENPEQ